jgi:5-methylcytosine-specific restriction endonuclease McrA
MTLASRQVLVLNKLWTPLQVITLQRAIGLLWKCVAQSEQPKAYIVDPSNFATFSWSDWSKLRPEEGEDCVHGVQDVYKIPEIIVLSEYDKLPKHTFTFSRSNLFRRDKYTCQYCGAKPGSEELTIDHVIPRARGGQTTWTNCVMACFDCNSRKADKTPKEVGLKLMREPFKPEYQLIKHRGRVCDSWKSFISEAYWEVEMVNDEPNDTDAKPKKKKKKKRRKKKR